MAAKSNVNPRSLAPEYARKIIADELLPLLPGCELNRTMKPSTSPHGLLVEFTATSVGIRFSETDAELFEVSRTHRFATSEKTLIKRFLYAIRRISSHRARFFWSHALVAAVRRAIVEALNYPNEPLL